MCTSDENKRNRLSLLLMNRCTFDTDVWISLATVRRLDISILQFLPLSDCIHISTPSHIRACRSRRFSIFLDAIRLFTSLFFPFFLHYVRCGEVCSSSFLFLYSLVSMAGNVCASQGCYSWHGCLRKLYCTVSKYR